MSGAEVSSLWLGKSFSSPVESTAPQVPEAKPQAQTVFTTGVTGKPFKPRHLLFLSSSSAFLDLQGFWMQELRKA